MNKKLLFGIMSLAALTACTSDDFESQEVAQKVSPIQFEVINNDALTRASENGNKIEWSAKDGDLFTLYHGCALPNAGQNATYKATANENGPATLTTPSMILPGKAIMVWPADTTFSIQSGAALTVSIPASLPKEKWVNHIPYVSDVMNIANYQPYSEAGPGIPAANKTAGVGRTYKIFMRPMASQLNLMADYANTDNTIATLYEGGSEGLTGDDAVEPIKVTSVDLESATDKFTTKIALNFTGAVGTNWGIPAAANNIWSDVTEFGAVSTSVAKLTTMVLNGNDGCKFLILPQAITTAADKKVVVNTIYGKVEVSAGNYGAAINDAWYRYRKAGSAVATGETETTIKNKTNDSVRYTANIVDGMVQTIGGFSNYTATSNNVVKGEPIGAAATRYVKVLLTKLDMSDLHIKNDKQLRDAARVWKKMGLPSVTVHLDGNSSNQFVITQKTITTINDINASAGGKVFSVTPCNTAGEVCNEIIITGGDKIQDLTFITDEDKTANVVLSTGFTWKWDGTVKVHTTGTVSTGIASIINRGTLENAEDKVLNTVENDGADTKINIKLKNDVPGEWNITGGRIRVQNEVENFGKVTISKGAQLIEDGAKHGAAAKFTNNALTLENRFIGGSGQRIGKVINNGVFATLAGGVINNYSLIEHADKDAKTYITSNELGGAFGTEFGANTNMKGRINLPYSNKDEDNISIAATDTPPFEGFISVTVDGDAPSKTLNTAAVGKFVNYIIVKSGIDDIALLPAQVEYLEVDTDHEVYWSVPTATPLTGLIVLSDVNIKLGTTMTATVTYLGAEMYVGGTFNDGTTKWNGYYGATGTRVAEHYLSY